MYDKVKIPEHLFKKYLLLCSSEQGKNFKIKRNVELGSSELLRTREQNAQLGAFLLSSIFIAPSPTNYESLQQKSSDMNAFLAYENDGILWTEKPRILTHKPYVCLYLSWVCIAFFIIFIFPSMDVTYT